MKILVNMKKMGKRRNSIHQVPYELENVPHTVRELIEQMVKVCVRDYNKNMENQELLHNLSLKEMEDMTEGGKISFGVNYGEWQIRWRPVKMHGSVLKMAFIVFFMAQSSLRH